MKIVALMVLYGFVAAGLSAQESFLAKPTGPFKVGRTELAWVDKTRPANPLKASAGSRELAVWVWYPASPAPGSQTAEWAPGKLGEVMFSEFAHELKQSAGAQATAQPTPEIMRSLRTHAYSDAPVSTREPRYPLLLFSPGLGEQPTSYADLIEELVSHGYIVAGIVHPSFVRVVVYPDGREVRSVPPNMKALGFNDEDCALS